MFTLTILPNHDLKVTLTETGKPWLAQVAQEKGEAFGADDTLYELFEGVVANSEYEWSRPEYIGALTAAPVLAVYGEEQAMTDDRDPISSNIVGHWEDTTWYAPVLRAWAFMDYAVTSPQQELLDKSECVWQCGWWTEEAT